MTPSSENVLGSFRDPSGFVFSHNGTTYRQVNKSYQEHYDFLMSSGLYQELSKSGLLISHYEADISCAQTKDAYKVLKPEPVPFISYPYEWCFSQLKDAALTMIEIQKRAIKYGMTLKDSSAYNIQFLGCKPVLIDTLSFEKYREGEPWIAYRQYCQHFLAPLALMSYRDVRLNQMFRLYIDGIPLDLAGRLLPFRTRLRLPLLLHIHLHAASQRRYADKPLSKTIASKTISRTSLMRLLENLETCVQRMNWHPRGTEWIDYYTGDHSYTSEALCHKQQIVNDFLTELKPRMVWDLGANIGMFSRLASNQGIETISFDIDPACVEVNYLTAVKNKETKILPLLLDLTNPSPSIGWENQERMSLVERGRADTVMALALVHHLAISNNVPLGRIARFMRKICRSLIIEFVPKSDPMVQKLLETRKDIFPDYTREAFEQVFSELFAIEKSVTVIDSDRTVYMMVTKEGRH